MNIKQWLLIAASALVLSACQPGDKKEDATKESAKASSESSTMKEEDKIGYALGAKMASFIKQDLDKNNLGLINKDSVARGFNDALADNIQLSEEEIGKQFAMFQQRIQAAQQQAAAEKQQKMKAEAEKAKTEGAAFLAENAKKEGVTTTKSGLQYQILKDGDKGAAKPKFTDNVKVHYTGSLIDGTVFDSSAKRGQPATFPLSRVIKGWIEGVQLMPVGSKFRFTIPSELAYGPGGQPGVIPGNAVLQFDIELIAINPEANKPAAKPAASKEKPAKG
ncbi:MAG: FKBP-type peptidyl-prolyl cis-trans isomerase [Enterobacterales bacterium]|nr:FKBP-type peptidyl-prolyl cis-trans isomerase [Enterobacterales bacterium]